MKRVKVKVQTDYLERIAKVLKPIAAIAELVWNSLDADATEVGVTLTRNTVGALDAVTVTDNGHGIPYEESEPAFGNLGGSWKKERVRSKSRGRLLHGKAGRGRFRAFSLGHDVVWKTSYSENGAVKEYRISGARSRLGEFSITEPSLSQKTRTGTTVVVSGIEKNFPSVEGGSAVQEITRYFALYLTNYPDVSIRYDGSRLNAAGLHACKRDFDLAPVELQDGSRVRPKLSVIEWETQMERALYLCDDAGFTVAETRPGIRARGFNFTAYLRCDILRALADDGAPILDEMDPDVLALLEGARSKLREYFLGRSAEAAAETVRGWKEQGIYPFTGQATSPVDNAKRQVFDVLALNVEEYLPAFDQTETKGKRLSFRLLRQALEDSPREVQKIISEVLGLPENKQHELAELLERTSLSAIINASKVVAHRLDFLRSLELLLFEHTEHLKERSQLHRLLENETWLFGEEFTLSVSDKSLTEVLRKHLRSLGQDDLSLEPVKRLDDTSGVVDLMLSRRIPQPNAKQREHLVVELKRPNEPVSSKVLQQIKSYAFAVAEDERFRDTDTRWVFWALSNKLTKDATRDARQHNKPPGQVYEAADFDLTIWAKTWGEVIEDCRARLEFFRDRLEYSPDDESALAKLQELYSRYVPDAVAKR